MDYSQVYSTEQIKLDTIPRARPTIPYRSRFLRGTREHSEPQSYAAAQSGDEDEDSDGGSIAYSPRRSSDMEEILPSGHRRRRSNLSNPDATSTRHERRPTRAKPSRNADRIAEEAKLSDDDGRWSGDDSRSTSDEFEMEELLDDEDDDDDDKLDGEEAALTGAEKKKRKRRHNTLLDHRIAGENKLTKQADQHVYKNLLINGILIGLWYIFSLSISIYNKWMFSPDHLDFTFPLFTTCMHMLVQFSLASLVLFFIPKFRPRHDSITNPKNAPQATEAERQRHEVDGKKPLMTQWFYITRLGPCGMATGLDIGFGNMSLKFITLTFYTMCKSSALAFVLGFAFLFRLETPSWKLVFIIMTMTAGVIMMVAGEVDFNVVGFILVILAAFFSGFRWGLTQILLLRNPATSNPFSSIFYLAPIMFVSLFILAVPIEGFGPLLQGFHALVEKKGTFWGPSILLFPGILAFLMTSSEFALLQRTSVVTLSIAGIFKEVVTISAAALVFHDPLTPINISGLFVTIGAIAAYNYIKITNMRAQAIADVQKAAEAAGGANDDSDDAEQDNYVTHDGDVLPKRSPSLGKLRDPLGGTGGRA